MLYAFGEVMRVLRVLCWEFCWFPWT